MLHAALPCGHSRDFVNNGYKMYRTKFIRVANEKLMINELGPNGGTQKL